MGIIVIDSNSSHLEQVIDILNTSGYGEISAFNSVRDAKKALIGEKHMPLNALLGINLFLIDTSSSMEGLQLIHDLRRSPVYKDTPIIVTNESNRSEAMSSAFAYGANDFISKPVQVVELKARVRSGLRLKFEMERRKAREHELIEVTNQLTDLNELLSNLSLIDSLTSIPNRRCFDETLEQEWRRAARHGGDLTLMMVDVDHFKKYNDTYGHQMGDSCLQDIAKVLGGSLRRPGDLVARYGGEEFAVILPNTSAGQCQALLKTIQTNLAALKIEHVSSSTAKIVTISIGIASVNPHNTSDTADTLVGAADKALYQAKENGRNCYVFADAMSQKIGSKSPA